MCKKLVIFFKDKDKKVLLENFVSLSALQLIGMILPIITLPYVLRVLGFENYGKIVFATSLIAYFAALTDFSFKYTATRDVALHKNSPKKMNIIYSKVLIVKAIFLILSLIIIGIAIVSYAPFYNNRLIYFLTVPMLLGNAIFPDWFFQGIEKMKYITFLNIGVKAFFTVCVFIFIKDKSDYWVYPLLQSGGFIVAGLVGQFILIKKYKLKLLWLKPKIILQTIRANIPIFVNQFVPTLYNNTSTFLLGLLTNYTLVGIYEAIKTIINLCVSIIDICSRVFFPFLSRKKEAFPKYKKYMLILGIILFTICLVSYKLVFWYLNIEYESAIEILAILAFGLIGYTLYNIFGINYFIIRRKDTLVMNNTIIASTIGFILAFPLIYYWGIVGAAIDLSLARWIMGGGLWYQYQKKNR